MTIAALTFTAFMLSFLVIGLSASRSQKDTVDDYLIGGREVSPWLNALSAASTNCSGFMFIGLIGLSYAQGIFAFWFVIGLALRCLGVDVSPPHRLALMVSAFGVFLICRQWGAPFGMNALACAWTITALMYAVLYKSTRV